MKKGKFLLFLLIFIQSSILYSDPIITIFNDTETFFTAKVIYADNTSAIIHPIPRTFFFNMFPYKTVRFTIPNSILNGEIILYSESNAAAKTPLPIYIHENMFLIWNGWDFSYLDPNLGENFLQSKQLDQQLEQEMNTLGL